MKSIKAAIAERKQKQAWLDEIHMRPNVKKLFTLSEILITLDALLTMTVIGVLLYGLASQDYENMNSILEVLDFEMFLLLIAHNAGSWVFYAVVLIGMVVAKKLKKKLLGELEVLEELGMREIQRAVDNGTYVPGPTVSTAFRVFRVVRKAVTWLLFIPYMLYTIISCLPGLSSLIFHA
jgi:hypothetical protein